MRIRLMGLAVASLGVLQGAGCGILERGGSKDVERPRLPRRLGKP